MPEQTSSEIVGVVETGKPKNKFDKIVIFFFSVVIVVGTIGLTCVLAGAAIARYVFRLNFYGFEEIAVLIAFWLYFAGATYGSYNRTHIAVSVVESYLQESLTKRILFFSRHLITVCVCALFTYYAYDFFEFGFFGPLGDFRFRPTTQLWRIPMWTSYLAVLVGFIFMEIYFIRDLILSGKALFGGAPPSLKTDAPQQELIQGEN